MLAVELHNRMLAATMNPDAPIDYPWQYREFVRLFNRRDYFEAHEVLEDLWVMEVGELRNYYKGLIMVAVALLHWQRANALGALRLYRDGMAYLSEYPETLEGIRLERLRDELNLLFRPLCSDPSSPSPAVSRHPVISISDSV